MPQPPGDHTEMNRATYDRIATRYRDRRQAEAPDGHGDRFFEELAERFATALPPCACVADLGCGPGIDAAAFAAAGHRVIGVDLSLGMLRWAADVLTGAVAQGDLRRLPLASGRLHGIWSSAALLHVPDADTEGVLGEFRRVLRRGGRLALLTAEGRGDRDEPVPYAPEETRWFVYRRADRLADQLGRAGFGLLHTDRLAGRRHWLAVGAEAR